MTTVFVDRGTGQFLSLSKPGARRLYRIPISITGSSDGSLTDFQVPVTLPYSIHMQADFGDIRFRDSNGVTLLSFWQESKTDGVTATYWVKVPSIAASPTVTTIYAYYGDPSLSGSSSITNTFILADDFNRTDLNTAHTWTKNASNPLTGYGYGDPFVWYEGGTFYIFAGSFTGGGLQGLRLFTAPLATPETLTNQGEILPLGTSGAWDDFWVSDPHIVKVGSTYHMWYSGCDGTGVTGIKIGHATASSISGPWTKDAGNPVFSKASNGTNEPSVYYDGSTYHMYYTYSTSGGTTDVGGGGTANIGYATSSDGVTWTDNGAVITGGYQDQFQIQDDNSNWHLFANDDSDPSTLYQFIVYTFTEFGLKSVNGTIVRGAGYDAKAAFAPSIVKVGATYYAYYQAQDAGGARLAVATSPSLETDIWVNSSSGAFVILSDQIYATATTGWQEVEHATKLTFPYVIEADLMLSAGSNDIGGLVVARDTINSIGVLLNPTANALRLYELGHVSYLDSNTTYTIDLSIPYKVRARVLSTSISADFYDTSWHSNVLSASGLSGMMGRTGFGGTNLSSNHFYGNNFRVRKYTANEPTISVGSEE